MARAFTKESDNESVDDLLPEPIEVLAPGARNYITPSGASAMREHVRTLTAQRTALLDSLRGEADPSEKKKLRELDRRIRYFEERIGGLEIVAPAAGPPMRVIFGTWVRVCD